MTTDTDDNKQRVSALVDGQLAGEELALGLKLLADDPQAREAWHAYHLIGDVLRQPALAASTPAPDFLERLSRRLSQEPLPRPVTALMPEPVVTTEAANDSVFRWKLVAGLASVAAVAAIGWSLASSMQAPSSSQLAGGFTTRIAGSANGPMLRDPRLDELLEAHRQLGGATALQAPAGGLHNAIFEAPAR